jgi:hypothetical protein
MLKDLEIMEEWKKYAAYMKPVSRRIMCRVACGRI